MKLVDGKEIEGYCQLRSLPLREDQRCICEHQPCAYQAIVEIGIMGEGHTYIVQFCRFHANWAFTLWLGEVVGREGARL